MYAQFERRFDICVIDIRSTCKLPNISLSTSPSCFTHVLSQVIRE